MNDCGSCDDGPYVSELGDNNAKVCAADDGACEEYLGVAQCHTCPVAMGEITLPATLESVAPAIEFVKNTLEGAGYPLKAQARLAVIVDEIVSNVARHAYGATAGDLTISVAEDRESGIVEVAFVDEGMAFNPLDVPLPDVTTAAGHEGGRGLMIVRRFADDITYERKNGKNILRIRVCTGRPVRKG